MTEEKIDVKIGTPREAMLKQALENVDKQVLALELELELQKQNLEYLKTKCETQN